MTKALSCFLLIAFFILPLSCACASVADTKNLSEVAPIVQPSIPTQYISTQYKNSHIYAVKGSYTNIKLVYTQKYKSLKTVVKENDGIAGVNASFYNMNNRKPAGLLVQEGKVIAKNVYNRPYLAITSNNVYISDAPTTTSKNIVTAMLGGGSFLLKDGKINVTSHHFDRGFHNLVVRRTAIGIDKNKNVIIAVITGANTHRTAEAMQSLGCISAINMDGDVSSQMVYNGKTIVSSQRNVPVVIVMKK